MPSVNQYPQPVEALIAEHGRMVSYPTAAEICCVSVRTLKRLTSNGELPVYRVGSSRTLRLKTVDVAKLVRRVA